MSFEYSKYSNIPNKSFKYSSKHLLYKCIYTLLYTLYCNMPFFKTFFVTKPILMLTPLKEFNAVIS